MFEQMAETASTGKPLVDLLAGLGLAAVFGAILLAVLKRNARLRQWRHVKDDLDDWAAKLLSQHERHPKELSDEDWRAECETMLSDARFTPTEIAQIIELAIITAKAATLDVIDSPQRHGGR